MSTRLPTYTYRALTQRNEIRLLLLLPDSYECTIHTTLDHYLLEAGDEPEYEALSYVWGESTSEHIIFCEGGPVYVTQSLFQALRRLRYRDRLRLLWIDRICINQADPLERGQQVRIMGRIFAAASEVTVWLGEDDTGDMRLVGDFIMALFETHKALGFYSGVPRDPEAWERAMKRNPVYESGRHALSNLLAVPWFERMWVFQEAVCAKELKFVFGSWPALPEAGLVLALRFRLGRGNVQHAFGEPFNNGDGLYNILQARITYQREINKPDGRSHKLSLMALLDRTKGMRATDPRDKIYALLGVANNQDSLMIQPRYDQAFEECYTTAAVRMMETSGSLLCLSLVLLTEAHQNKLPTWVPDFRTLSMTWFKHVRIDPDFKLYCSSGSSRVQIRDNAPKTQLALQALYIGTIIAGSCLSGTDSNVNVIGRSVADPDNWLAFVQTSLSVPNSKYSAGSIETIFTAMISGDVVMHGDGFERLHGRCRSTEDRISWEDLEPATNCKQNRQGLQLTPATYAWAKPIEHATHAQRMIHLDTGYLGLATRACEVGDQVFILMGADMPCVLRANGNGQYFYLSEGYIHGIMDGEALVDARRRADPTWQADDKSWLQELGDPPHPFKTEEVILV